MNIMMNIVSGAFWGLVLFVFFVFGLLFLGSCFYCLGKCLEFTLEKIEGWLYGRITKGLIIIDRDCYQRSWALERIEALVEAKTFKILRRPLSQEIVGYLLYREELEADRLVMLVRILRFGIRKNDRGKGIGRQLMLNFIGGISSQERILIEIPEDRKQNQALAFLRTLGFKEIARKKFRSATPWGTGVITMELDRSSVRAEKRENHQGAV